MADSADIKRCDEKLKKSNETIATLKTTIKLLTDRILNLQKLADEQEIQAFKREQRQDKEMVTRTYAKYNENRLREVRGENTKLQSQIDSLRAQLDDEQIKNKRIVREKEALRDKLHKKENESLLSRLLQRGGDYQDHVN